MYTVVGNLHRLVKMKIQLLNNILISRFLCTKNFSQKFGNMENNFKYVCAQCDFLSNIYNKAWPVANFDLYTNVPILSGKVTSC